MKIDMSGETPTGSKEQVIRIMSSKGDKSYNVTIKGDVGVHCECPGFNYRGRCRHLAEAEALCDPS